MSEAAPEPEPKAAAAAADVARKPAPAPVIEDKSLTDVLKGMLGKVVMFVNAESFEEGGLGYTLEAGWYRGKLIGLGNDYLIVMSEFKRGVGKKATKEPVKQYVPLEKVKRISVLKTQIIVHI
ncbi:MAG: hypothetical protein ACYST0_04560 [Planctomycetota bacterium]|jgi:hypothetical protein